MGATSLANRSDLAVASNAVAAGTGTTNCTAVDLKDYEGCRFIAQFGAIVANAVTTMHLEESDDNSTFSDLEGTEISIADDDDNGVAHIDLVRPKKRYARLVIVRATQNATIEAALNEPYHAHNAPTSQSAVSNEIHVSPDAGTK